VKSKFVSVQTEEHTEL